MLGAHSKFIEMQKISVMYCDIVWCHVFDHVSVTCFSGLRGATDAKCLGQVNELDPQLYVRVR